MTKLHLNGQLQRFNHVTVSPAIEQDKIAPSLATMERLDALGLGSQYRIQALKRPVPVLISERHGGVRTNHKAHRIDPYTFSS